MYQQWGKYKLAEDYAAQVGMTARKDRMGIAEQVHLDATAARIVALYRDWGKPDKAAEWAAEWKTVHSRTPASVVKAPVPGDIRPAIR